MRDTVLLAVCCSAATLTAAVACRTVYSSTRLWPPRRGSPARRPGRTALGVLTALAFAAAACAQTAAVVAVRQPAMPATQLFHADLSTGAITGYSRFASDGLAPLAVVVDVVDKGIVVALDAGGGSSRIVRLGVVGTTVSWERALAVVPGRVTDMVLVDYVGRAGGTVVIAVGGASGGLYAVPRNGGTLRRLASLPRAAGVTPFGQVVQAGVSGPQGVAPRLSRVDLQTGQVVGGPVALPAIEPAVTGVTDFGVAALVATQSAKLWAATLTGSPVRIVGTPPLPSGATTEVNGTRGLGGTAHPFLISLPLIWPTWSVLAGPFPGTPVDFDGVFELPQALPFGEACLGPRLTGIGRPLLGLPFTLQLGPAPASTPVAFVLGGSDQGHLGLSLPLALPLSGCQLYVSPDVAAARAIGSAGTARLTLQIPNDPALRAAPFFAQGVLPALGTTNGVAVHVGG